MAPKNPQFAFAITKLGHKGARMRVGDPMAIVGVVDDERLAADVVQTLNKEHPAPKPPYDDSVNPFATPAASPPAVRGLFEFQRVNVIVDPSRGLPFVLVPVIEDGGAASLSIMRLISRANDWWVHWASLSMTDRQWAFVSSELVQLGMERRSQADREREFQRLHFDQFADARNARRDRLLRVRNETQQLEAMFHVKRLDYLRVANALLDEGRAEVVSFDAVVESVHSTRPRATMLTFKILGETDAKGVVR